jgi:nitroimidazol reductase NimA-like FMN-containing flavoprotein (pyridoxamine 5'-phosphate oxidase superfamily)
MSYAMTRAEREAFLAETRVGILAVSEPGRAPLAVPVWYHYAPGGPVRIVTGSNSLKGRLLRTARRASLCVQTETAPYRYVSVEGPVALGEPDHERDVRATALRYLGEQMGEMYLAMTAEERASEPGVLVELQPARWRSVDYGKMIG